MRQHARQQCTKHMQTETLAVLSETECHIMPCVGLAVAAPQQLLATGGNDGTVTVWDTASKTMLNCIYQADSHCNAVALSHDGSLLAYSGATEGPVHTYAEAAAAAESSARRDPQRRLAALDIAEGFGSAAESPFIHKCV